MRHFMLITMLTTAVMATDAQANFVDLDIDFEDAALGSSLLRRGPEFGEPIPGTFDTSTDEIISGNGSQRVQITDTANPNPELLYWGFYEGRSIDTGSLVIEATFTTSDLAFAGMTVLGANDATDIFFNLLLEPDGDLSYLDAATPNPTVFSTYVPRNDLVVRLLFNVDAGTYGFELNGSVIFSNKPHSVSGGIERFSLGFAGGATGTAMVQDDLFAYRTNGPFVELLFATFNGHPLGPIGTGGAADGEPVQVPTGGADVVTGGFPSKSLEICDSSPVAQGVRFEFLNLEEVDQGSVCIRLSLRFDQLDQFYLRLREQGSSGQSFLNLHFEDDGDLIAFDEGGFIGFLPDYTPNTRIDLVLSYQMDLGVYYLWMEDELVIKGEPHDVTGDGLGAILVGYLDDPTAAGCVRVDDILVVKTPAPATAAPDAVPGIARPQLMPASPNPFNPATQLRFELPRAGDTSLRLYDAAGRWVITLTQGHLGTGTHQVVWTGRDASGRPASSGVYFARLRSGSHEDLQKLVLLK